MVEMDPLLKYKKVSSCSCVHNPLEWALFFFAPTVIHREIRNRSYMTFGDINSSANEEVAAS